MSHHLFIRKEPVQLHKQARIVWRCDKCDSEVKFEWRMTQHEVNQAVMLRWPKLLCIKVEPN